jgi:hypothetical protein
VPSSGMLRHVALVRIEVSEEISSSIIRETRIGELGTAFAVTSNRLLQEPHGVTSQRTAFFIVTAVEISNRTRRWIMSKVVIVILLYYR